MHLTLVGSHHLQAAARSLRALYTRPLAALMTITVIAITLTLPALFWFFTAHMDEFTKSWQRSGQISLYLKSSTSEKEQTACLLQVRSIHGVAQATLKTPEDGLQELQAQEGMEDIMHYLPENPLPAVIEVLPALNMDDPEKLKQLYRQIKSLPAVEQAKLDMQWVSRLHALSDLLYKAVYGLSLLLALAVIFIIGNTLRLAIQNQREEIQILKLIGATDSYIIRPFLYSGIWLGIAGALLAVVLVDVFILSLKLAASQLAAAYQMDFALSGLSLQQTLLLLFSAIILGWLAARLSVKGQLASIEPYI